MRRSLWRVAAQCINITFSPPSPTLFAFPPCALVSTSAADRCGSSVVAADRSTIVFAPILSTPTPFSFRPPSPVSPLDFVVRSNRGSVYVVGLACECSFCLSACQPLIGSQLRMCILAPHTLHRTPDILVTSGSSTPAATRARSWPQRRSLYIRRRTPVLRLSRCLPRGPFPVPRPPARRHRYPHPPSPTLVADLSICLIYHRHHRNVNPVEVLGRRAPVGHPVPSSFLARIRPFVALCLVSRLASSLLVLCQHRVSSRPSSSSLASASASTTPPSASCINSQRNAHLYHRTHCHHPRRRRRRPPPQCINSAPSSPHSPHRSGRLLRLYHHRIIATPYAHILTLCPIPLPLTPLDSRHAHTVTYAARERFRDGRRSRWLVG
ncbi:hypothetical protein C2E23DRAFT_196189 [Lenzites betulinus]|nr:hypothetical protein C2E23DRAFT_196189 [Lenzites betulinus]